MERAITASEASENFSDMLRDVQSGESFVVTSLGEPVARILPVENELADQSGLADQSERFIRLIEYLRTLPVRTIGPWTREELCD